MAQANNQDRKLVEQMIHESEVGPYAYDSALIDDLKFRLKRKDGTSVVSDTVYFSSPEDDMELQALVNQDNVVLPFISLQRTRVEFEFGSSRGSGLYRGENKINS